MAILLGIDFDNTIVCYDGLFHRLAVDRGLIPGDLPARKSSVRDYLRAEGREDAWTELQGYAYGPGIADAQPFDGAVEFFARCAREGIGVRIVSHKTRHPFIGPPYDLHEAATAWLTRRGFFDASGANLSPDQVFFGLTKEDKLRRIADLGCTHFVDDLPEFLGDPSFPPRVDRILFDPAGEALETPFRRIGSWQQLSALIFGQSSDVPDDEAIGRLLSEARQFAPFTINQLEGGGNNRVFRVDAGPQLYLVKMYFDSPGDSRDRLKAEFSFSQFAWRRGIRALPQPLACDPSARLALYEFVDGCRPAAVTERHVDAAIAFYSAVNESRDAASAQLPEAADARFSLAAHAEGIERRVASLAGIADDSPMTGEAASFVGSLLRPLWDRLCEAARSRARALGLDWAAPLPESGRRLSPSDFGFHNALIRRNGELAFLDFEYAGWDDPAKLVSDFFCQPAIPVPLAFRDRFLRGVGDNLEDPVAFRHRCDVLWPLYQVRWVCIMLNDFLPVGGSRRRFARGPMPAEQCQAAQLQKARVALAAIPASA